VVVALLLGLLVWGWTRVRAIEDDALELATVGKAAIALLNEFAAGIATGDSGRILTCYSSAFESDEGPWREELVDTRDAVTVKAWHSGPPAASDAPKLVAETLRFVASLGDVEWSKGKLAIVESQTGTEAAVVRALLWLRGTSAAGQRFEAQAHLRLWIVTDAAGNWRIERQELLDGTTVSGPGAGFTDHATAAGLDFATTINPRFSDPDWRLEAFGIAKYAGPGAAAADYDGDGWYDLFLGDGVAPRLYRNEGAGGALHFRDVTAEVGLPTRLPGTNLGLFVDFDDDGDEDLFIGRFMDGNKLFRNDAGLFTEIPIEGEMERGLVTVAAARDYDGDGRLDLYLGRYLDPRTQMPTTMFYTRNGAGNSLLHNDGDLRFTDVTAEAGVREGGLALGVSWADYDDDGDDDLYVANDFGRNALLRNEGDGTFSDVSAESGTLDFGFGMSSSWGDVDNDGDLDIYVSNVHSGQRWYGQATTLAQYLLTSIKQGTIRQDYPLYKEIFGYTGPDWRLYGDGMVKGNSLLLNDGHGHFAEKSEVAGTNPQGWYWGSGFLDYDNDGQLDIYAANGWISGKTYDDL
jgi:hypothetical protein